MSWLEWPTLWLYGFFILLTRSATWLIPTCAFCLNHHMPSTLRSLQQLAQPSPTSTYPSVNHWDYEISQPFLIKRRTKGVVSWLKGFSWSPRTTRHLPPSHGKQHGLYSDLEEITIVWLGSDFLKEMHVLVLLQCPGKNSIYASEFNLRRGFLHTFGRNELVSNYSLNQIRLGICILECLHEVLDS